MINRTKIILYFVLAGSVYLSAPGSALAALNFLGNGGFEEAIGNGNDAGNWDNTNGAIRVNAGTLPGGFSAIPEGVFALAVEAGTFTFQLSTNVQPGDVVTFSGKAESNIPAVNGGGKLKIEFKNDADALLLSNQTADITTTNAPNSGGYQTFSVSATAPAGTTKVVLVMDAPDNSGPAPGTRYVIYDEMVVTLPATTLSTTGNSGVLEGNVLGNPGIEMPIGGDLNWDSTNGATRASAADLATGGFASAPEGNSALLISNGSFTFQTLANKVQPGDVVTFSALAQSTFVGSVAGGRLKIEFHRIENGSDTLIDSTGVSAFMNATTAEADPANPYVYFAARATAPEGANSIVFVVETTGAFAGNIAVDNLHATINPVNFTIAASAGSVQPGGSLTIVGQFSNTSSIDLAGVEFVSDFPQGFNVIRSTVRMNGAATEFREGSIIVPVGTLAGGQSVSVSFVAVATTAVRVGKSYTLRIVFRDSTGRLLSRTVVVEVEQDPLFDEGTIIGKVFNDLNQNGIQDGCAFEGTEEVCSGKESGVPWVRLFTEEGIIIITDEHGRYHVPAVKPGRHIVKIDSRTLPEGTKFVTEESFLVKTTPGLLSKANFAVLVPPSEMPKQFQKDLMVTVTQGLDTSRPTLSVQMDPTILRLGVGKLEREVSFKLKLNYPEVIKTWFLEIRDESGREVWTGYGISQPPAEVVWAGQTEQGLLIKPGIYSYQLKVEDDRGNQDWTPLQFFRVVSKTDKNWDSARSEIPAIGDFNLFKDGKSSIPLVAKPTIRIQGRTHADSKIKINGREVEVDDEGLFHTELYVTPGNKEIVVDALSREGETTSFRKKIKVKDSTFFMVALAEEQMGTNFQDGNSEVFANDDLYKSGFYEDGRLSYYLTGKIKGKFLVKSHYDTDDKRSALFTNLDPDDYYPIYGDGSTRNYEAMDTLKRFYMVVEVDKSYAKYGSFKTEFNDTELARYDRTLSGLKVNHDSVKSTAYGDPMRGFKLFWTQAAHRADHNEFAATGGSLYYLRNRNVIEGSEKLRVVIKDKIQDFTIESRDLIEGVDYELDYSEGRILLSRPLSSVAISDTLVSDDLMDGNQVYLVADYEYHAGTDVFATPNRGIRGYTHMGNHIRIGGTAVEEKRQGGNDYDMRGLDATFKIGRNTKLSAEYATANANQTDQSVSYNGGLSFADLNNLIGQNTHPREDAYLFKGETKPIKNFEVAGYMQGVRPTFSTAHSRSQEGTKKYGIASRYKFNDVIYARYRFDSNEIDDALFPLATNRVVAPYQDYQTHTAQLVFDDGKWLGQAEYRAQAQTFPAAGDLQETVLSEMAFRNGIAGKLGYHVNDRLLPYIKVQLGLEGHQNHQYGGGIRARLVNNVYGYLEEMVGPFGDSTYFGFEQVRENGLRQYANLKMHDRGIGSKTLASAIGSSYQISEKSRVFSEREHSLYQGVDGYADILGYDGKPGDNWNFEGKYERRRLSGERSEPLELFSNSALARNNHSNVISGAVAYADRKKLRARSALEVSLYHGDPQAHQWVSRNYLEYKLNKDLSYLGKLDYGRSMFTSPDDLTADFTEMSTGFAYRPVDNDRFNALTRYSYIRNLGNDVQFATPLFNGVEEDKTMHILAIDLAYELNRYFGLVEKLAWRRSALYTSLADEVIVYNFLWITRLNYHVTRKWDIGLEYRTLFQFDALHTLNHGALIEVDRELYDYVRLGMGYNFTDFEDDLRKADNYSSHGPFVRLTGKF